MARDFRESRLYTYINSRMAELELGESFRNDGRKTDELRKMVCQMGIFIAPDGSSYVQQGKTEVICSVYKSRQVMRPRSVCKVLVNYKVPAASSTEERQRQARGHEKKSREISVKLHGTFEGAITSVRPQSQIHMKFTVLHSDGADLAACVNAGTLALIDANAPIRNYVCACTSGFLDGHYMVDLTHFEETLGGAVWTIAMTPNSECIGIEIMTVRSYSDHQIRLLDMAIKGCFKAYGVLYATVQKYAEKKKSLQITSR